MENQPYDPDIEAEIAEVMRTTNLLRIDAAALVARRHGENVDDIVGPDGPLTEEQRRRVGLGGSLAEMLDVVSTPSDPRR